MSILFVLFSHPPTESGSISPTPRVQVYQNEGFSLQMRPRKSKSNRLIFMTISTPVKCCLSTLKIHFTLFINEIHKGTRVPL